MTEKAGASVHFSDLVANLAAAAVSVLAHVESLQQEAQGAQAAQGAPTEASDEGSEESTPEEKAKRIEEGLAGVRRLIDTLVVLEEKTSGNLDAEEQKILQNAIAELRLHFVGLDNRAASATESGEECGVEEAAGNACVGHDRYSAGGMSERPDRVCRA